MAVGASIASTLGAILKDLYLPPVVEQLNNEILLVQRLEKSSDEIFGNQAIVPLHVNRSGGIGSRAENAALPTAGSQGYAKAVYDLKYHYGRVRVTGVAMAKTASSAGAFLKALEGELDGVRNDLKMDIARQVYADGTAQIVTCGTSTTTTVIVIASAEPILKGELYIGQTIDIGTAAAPSTIAAGVSITDVNTATPSVTISGSNVTTSSSHFIFRAGNAVDATHVNELTGLKALVSQTNNTVGGIDSSAAGNSYWQNQRGNAAGALSLDIMTKAFNTVTVQGGQVSLMIGSPGMQRALFNLLQAQVRYVDPLDIKGGFKALEYMGQPFVADRQAPFGSVFFLDERFIKVFSNNDWHFLDEDGTTLKWVVGFDAWEAVLARYMNLGISRRNVQFVEYGLNNDPAGI
jgi:hypothetical protein